MCLLNICLSWWAKKKSDHQKAVSLTHGTFMDVAQRMTPYMAQTTSKCGLNEQFSSPYSTHLSVFTPVLGVLHLLHCDLTNEDFISIRFAPQKVNHSMNAVLGFTVSLYRFDDASGSVAVGTLQQALTPHLIIAGRGKTAALAATVLVFASSK